MANYALGGLHGVVRRVQPGGAWGDSHLNPEHTCLDAHHRGSLATHLGSVKKCFCCILIHEMTNVREFLFPNNVSHDDPLITGLITNIAVITIAIVWGSKTLTREPQAIASQD